MYSAAGPHTIVDGKEVVNFASANYLGLIGNEKIIVRDKSIPLLCPKRYMLVGVPRTKAHANICHCPRRIILH